MTFGAVVLSRVWNMYRDVRAIRFLVRCWNPDTHTFFFPYGETIVTIEDMERICLLPSMGDMDPLELRLSDEEFTIAGKLLETFRGTSTSWGGNRAWFSFWISEFKESEDVDTRRVAFLALWISKCVFNFDMVQFMKPFTFPLAVATNWVVEATSPNGELQFLGFKDGLPLLMKWMGLKVWNLLSITLLDDGAHFAWKPYSYVAAGFCYPNPFPNARPESPEFRLNDHEKIPNFLLITPSSHIPYPSGGPTNEDTEMIGKSLATDVTAGENIDEMLGQGHASEDPKVTVYGEAVAGKGPDVTVITREAVAELRVESSGATIKGMSLKEFLEKFAEDEENDKVAADFYPLSNDIVMFQRFEIPAEGQPLLAAIVRKHPHSMTECKLGASLRKSRLQLLVAVLLDMHCTKLDRSNLRRAIEWKNALKDLLFMKFGA
nr:hypothetical protein CFP56_40364 [Quercus suber]